MKPCFCGLLILGLFLAMAEPGQGQPTYAFSTLDVPGASFAFGLLNANGINDSGQIVGTYGGGAGINGFLLDQGRYTTLDVPGANSGYDGTQANGINALGQIVGSYGDAAGNLHGF